MIDLGPLTHPLSPSQVAEASLPYLTPPTVVESARRPAAVAGLFCCWVGMGEKMSCG